MLESSIGARLLEGPVGIPLLLPHEFTATLILAGNTDPFGVDQDRTTLLTTNTDPFDIDPELTILIS